MADSPLVEYERYTRKFSTKTGKNRKITPHHSAGIWQTAKEGVDYFFNSKVAASATYVIGNDGSIGQCVKESDRAWTSNNYTNDNQAVTIEVSNSARTDNWPISDAAYNSLVTLCADICNRNQISAVNYTGTPDGIITEHRMFKPTLCPGPYIHDLLVSGKLVQDINAAIKNSYAFDINFSDFSYKGLDYAPVFNPTYYSSRYPDLFAAGLKSEKQLFQHFILFGMSECRKASSDFDPVTYRKQYPDIEDVFDDDWEGYYKHYLLCGKDEIATGQRQKYEP